MTVRDLALAIAQEHGLDASAAALRPAIANVRNALFRPRDMIVSDTLQDGRLAYRVGAPWGSGAARPRIHRPLGRRHRGGCRR